MKASGLPTTEARPQSDVYALYSEHYGWLHKWLSRKLGCSFNAADLAQDTFLRLTHHNSALQGLQEPQALLITVAKRLMIDRARRQQLEQRYLAELTLINDLEMEQISDDDFLAAFDAAEQIDLLLRRMPNRAKEAFLLHYRDGLTKVEVANQLGVSIRTIHLDLAQIAPAATCTH